MLFKGCKVTQRALQREKKEGLLMTCARVLQGYNGTNGMDGSTGPAGAISGRPLGLVLSVLEGSGTGSTWHVCA